MKLTLVSIVVYGKRYSAFVYLSGKQISVDVLHEIFPALNLLPVGATYSIG